LRAHEPIRIDDKQLQSVPKEEHPPSLPNFLRGGGEMGALMRGTRWEDTPLGPVQHWSPALRTIVGVLLGNRFPMLVLWGPKLIQLYNDAYRPILGDKHPRSLGQSCSECWPEIWPIVGPMIEAPFRGEPATWDDDLTLAITRRGFLEECHFKCAYNPVPDDTAEPTGIGGVIAPASETSEKVYGERQLKALRELAMGAANAKTAEQACQAAASTLSTATRDVPFALFYLCDRPGDAARLVGAYGFERAEQISPSEWPTDERGLVVIDDLSRFREHLPLSEWHVRPTRAVVIPLASPDQQRGHGFVVAGTSPHRAFDEDYRGFFELAGAQIVTAIRNARAFETERQRAETLATLDEAKTAFFSNVSHEFRTPLTLMLGPIEEGLQDLEQPLPPRQRGRQEVVYRSSLRLLKLVNSLLDFSRIEAGRVQARYQPTDLGAYTADLASSFRSLVEKAGLRLVVDCPSLAEPVYVDREMYEKIVLNLLSNAFKFTLSGEIRVSVSMVGDSARLVVADTGTGIPDSELPHLFERFHRVQGANGRSYEGSGIGLAMVQELVKLHGGSVAVSSRLDRGSVFTVSLPLRSGHLDPERIEAGSKATSTWLGPHPFINEAWQWLNAGSALSSVAEAVNAPTAPVAGAGRILLCDDNADMRQYVGQLLVAQGWDVEAVEDGAAALTSVEARLPDLVLSDVMMPKLDGFGVLRALRQDEKTRHLPVILLSARAGEEARVEGMDAGADDYLVKPFAARELVARVRAQLSAARERKEAARVSEAARSTAEQENQRKDEFLAMLSHELRNPMAAISMALDMMERSAEDPVATARHRETMQRQMRNLARLVDDLLDVSLITRGKVELKQRTMDFASLVQHALTSARSTIDARAHALSVSIASGDYQLEGDEARLEQVVVNLLINAAKYTEPGGAISVTLTRDMTDSEPQAVLSVRDTGRGIPAEMLEKVFDVFVQVSPSLDRSSGGLGLGLTLVKRLIEMHAGSVVARSEGPGKGSEFLVRVPLRTGSQPHPEPKRATLGARATARQKRRVLLVEDSDEFREILQEMLEDLGHEVVVARDGLSGVTRILELRPDLALIDLGLPGIDGYEVARRVRGAENGADIYLVALTGYGGADDKAEAERAGYDRHLTKPISVDQLVQVVSSPRPRTDA
jgi:signal transduction histidine kinase